MYIVLRLYNKVEKYVQVCGELCPGAIFIKHLGRGLKLGGGEICH